MASVKASALILLAVAIGTVPPTRIAAAPPGEISGGDLVVTMPREGEISSIIALGEEIPLIRAGTVLWARDLTDVLSGPSLLEGVRWTPTLEPEGFDVDPRPPIAVRCEAGARGVTIVASDPVPVEPGREYSLSAVISSSNGFLGGSASPTPAVAVRWVDEGGEVIGEEVVVRAEGGAPSPKRFTNFTRAPDGAATAVVAVAVLSASRTDPKVFHSVSFLSVEMRPLPREAEWHPVPLEWEGDGGSLAGSWHGLSFRVIPKGKESSISFEVSADNLEERPRAVEVAVALPVDARGWRWWVDLETAVQVGAPGTYRPAEVNSLVSGGYLPTSLYPVAAVEGDDVGISVWVPLEVPTIYRTFYSTDMGIAASFSLGLTEAGTAHSSASVAAEFSSFEAGPGIRAAVDEYQRVHEGWFEPRVDVLSEIDPDLLGEGRAVVQVHLQYPAAAAAVAALARSGAYVTQYVLPWEFEPEIDAPISGPAPSADEVWRAVGDLAGGSSPQASKARACLSSAVVGEGGGVEIAQYLRGPGWRPDRWVARVPMNPDPDLPGFNVWNYTETLLEAALSNSEAEGFRPSGVELDNFMGRSMWLDPRAEAAAAYGGPLTYNPNGFRPAVHLSGPAVEYLETLRSWVEAEIPGGGITGNFVAEGPPIFGAARLDALPFECNPRGFNWGRRELLYRRFLARWKPAEAVLTNYSVNVNSRAAMRAMWEFLNTSVFYGFFPALKDDVYGDPRAAEVLRPMLRGAVEAALRMSSAGWEPITSVEVRPGDVLAERFGGGPGDAEVLISLLNPSDREVEVEVRPSPDLVGADSIQGVEVVWGRAEPSLDGDAIRVSLRPGEAVVLAWELGKTGGRGETGEGGGGSTRSVGLRPAWILPLLAAALAAAASYLLLRARRRGGGGEGGQEGRHPNPAAGAAETSPNLPSSSRSAG